MSNKCPTCKSWLGFLNVPVDQDYCLKCFGEHKKPAIHTPALDFSQRKSSIDGIGGLE